jgi:hypothetical protein
LSESIPGKVGNMRPPHAAAIKEMGEGSLDHLAAPLHGLPPDARFQPRPVGVNRFARRLYWAMRQPKRGQLLRRPIAAAAIG